MLPIAILPARFTSARKPGQMGRWFRWLPLLLIMGCSNPSVSENTTQSPASSIESSETSEAESTGAVEGYSESASSSEYFRKVLTLPVNPGNNNQLELVLPLHVTASIETVNSSQIEVKFNLYGESQSELDKIQQNYISQVARDNKIRVKYAPEAEEYCEGIGIMNGSIMGLNGACLATVDVLLPQNSNLNIYEASSTGQPELIWQGQLPETATALIESLQAMDDDESKIDLVNRFLTERPQAPVTLQDLKAFADAVFFSSEKMEVLQLVTPRVKQTQGIITEQDLEPLISEMNRFDQEEVKDLFFGE